VSAWGPGPRESARPTRCGQRRPGPAEHGCQWPQPRPVVSAGHPAQMPLDVLGYDLLVECLSHVDHVSVVRASFCCQWLNDAARDTRLWKWLCCSFWHSRHPHRWRSLLQRSDQHRVDWRQTFVDALLDSARITITEDELCQISWMVTFTSRWEGLTKRQGFFLPNHTYTPHPIPPQRTQHTPPTASGSRGYATELLIGTTTTRANGRLLCPG
jgi:hypothetical protein